MLKIQYQAYGFLKSEVFDFLPSVPAKGDTINITGTDLVATYNGKYEDGVFIFELNK